MKNINLYSPRKLSEKSLKVRPRPLPLTLLPVMLTACYSLPGVGSQPGLVVNCLQKGDI